MAATLWIALGGALGSAARYWLGRLAAPFSGFLPWGTILINIGGSFLIAFFGALTLAQTAGRWPVSENIRLFAMAGFCGGFTTFSTFSLQNFELLRQGAFIRAFANMALSVLLCLLACALGALAAEKLCRTAPQPLTAAKSGRRENLPEERIIRSRIEEEA